MVDFERHSLFESNKIVRAKLHYTDTGYEHRLRTPPMDKLTTILQQICHIATPEPNISTCQDVGMWQIFVRWWCSLVVFVAGVRSQCPCPIPIRYDTEFALENWQDRTCQFSLALIVEFGSMPRYRQENPTFVQGNNLLDSNNEHLSRYQTFFIC